jgi:hypothetical protein
MDADQLSPSKYLCWDPGVIHESPMKIGEPAATEPGPAAADCKIPSDGTFLETFLKM